MELEIHGGLFFLMNNKYYLFLYHFNLQANIKSIFTNKNWNDLLLRWRYVLSYSMRLYSQIQKIPEKNIYNLVISNVFLNETISVLKYNKPNYSIEFFLFKIYKKNVKLSTIEKLDLNIKYPSNNISELSFNERILYNELLVQIGKNINIHGFIEKHKNLYVVQDQKFDYNITTQNLNNDNDFYNLIISATNIQSIIPSTFSMRGDMNIKGDIIVSNLNNTANFFNVDPEEKYVGIGTDERYVDYLGEYKSLTNTTTPRISTVIYSETYPNLLCERVADNADDVRLFTKSFSASTMKRFSKIYSYEEMYAISEANNNQYGVDIAFEMRDKSNYTQEIGNVAMVIESIDENGKIRGAFKVIVRNIKEDNSVLIRDILYVSNDGTLKCNKVNLGEKDLHLEAKDGNLFYGGRKIEFVPESVSSKKKSKIFVMGFGFIFLLVLIQWIKKWKLKVV